LEAHLIQIEELSTKACAAMGMFSPCVAAFGVPFLFGSAAISYFRSSEIMVYVLCGCSGNRQTLQLPAPDMYLFHVFCCLATILQKYN
jgi:hypothetical protein